MSDNFDCKGIVASRGLVFGDIGTSPIYTLTVTFPKSYRRRGYLGCSWKERV